MYKLIESADYDTLFAAYLADHDRYTGGVFSEYDLIISTLPEGDILLQKLADARGIASGVRPRYWTSFYWHPLNDLRRDRFHEDHYHLIRDGLAEDR